MYTPKSDAEVQQPVATSGAAAGGKRTAAAETESTKRSKSALKGSGDEGDGIEVFTSGDEGEYEKAAHLALLLAD